MLAIFWIVMLVDAATRKFKESSDKIMWILIIVLVGWLGALIYYFVVYRKYKSAAWFWIILLLLLLLLVLGLLLSFLINYTV